LSLTTTITLPTPPAPAGPELFRVPVSALLLLPNIPAGMDLAVVGGLVALMRKTAQDPPPIDVRPVADGLWLVLDGRHRYFGAVIAGRPDVLARREVAPSPTATP
jgi:hypothetical protein